MRNVDVVVVSYNSEPKIARCVEGLAEVDGVGITVVDNASADGTLSVLARLPVKTIALDWNSGFAHGCNAGWRSGSAPYVLFLNPDASIDVEALDTLVGVLDSDRGVGLVAPRIVHEDGATALSLRRYPSLRRAFAQAFFLHRVWEWEWADEMVSESSAYERSWSPDWVSGACVLIRRSLLEELGGFDERFFLYSEDVDLCRRVRAAGFDVRFEPAARCIHTGGASAPRGAVLPLMAKSRWLYARKHERAPVALLYGAAIALSSLTHAVLAPDADRRRGHLRALAGLASRPAVPGAD